MFDHDLAQRVERQLGLGHSRSVSMLVAPAIAAAVANRRNQATVPAGRRVLLLTEVTVERDSVAVGKRLGELDESGGLRVLARQEGTDWDWTPAFDKALQPGVRIAVAGTRSGLARLLLATRAPHLSESSGRIDP
jgi:Trk K+ transport system NAD-binding subunit